LSLLLLLLALLQGSAANDGRIEGVVMNVGVVLQQPLGNARLELSGPGGSVVTRTNAAGRFVFSNLAPGRYRIDITRDGYIRQTSPPIVLGRDQHVNDVAFNLQPAPIILGTVLDANGQPKSNVLVEALRMGYGVRGGRLLTALASVLTDDYGRYRLYWLDPGEYKIVAHGSPPTYYPGMIDPGEAQAIRLKIGRELDLGEFRVNQPLPTLFVTGWVVSDITGKALPVSSTVTLSLQGMVDTKYRFEGSTIKNDCSGLYEGRPCQPPPLWGFSIGGVLNGVYAAVAQASDGQQGLSIIDTRQVSESQPYCPAVQDSSALFGRGRCILNARIVVGLPLGVKGRIVTESGSSMDARGAQVGLTSVEPVLPSPHSAPVARDGTFDLNGVQAGSYLLSVSGLPDDAYVKSARVGKTDALESLVEARYGASDPLEIVLSPNGGRLSGATVDGNGQRVAGADVVLVPDPKLRYRVDQYKTETSDRNGAFIIRGIPPGDYKLFAWEKVEPNAYLNADFMRDYEALGIPVRIQPSGQASLQAPVIPVEP
jgi:hypothetical protein